MPRRRSPSRLPLAARFLVGTALPAVLLLGTGCSKKLSSGGGAIDAVVYAFLGRDRGTAYYYDVVQGAHDRKTFCYRCTEAPYLADKCVDAIVHLGDAPYVRLEGEVQVILLL